MNYKATIPYLLADGWNGARDNEEWFGGRHFFWRKVPRGWLGVCEIRGRWDWEIQNAKFTRVASGSEPTLERALAVITATRALMPGLLE